MRDYSFWLTFIGILEVGLLFGLGGPVLEGGLILGAALVCFKTCRVGSNSAKLSLLLVAGGACGVAGLWLASSNASSDALAGLSSLFSKDAS